MAKKKRKNKKLTNKQIAAKLRKARVVKSLPEYKTSRDKTFRKHAQQESLIPTTSLNAEIRERATKRKRASKGQIKTQEDKIKELTRQNKKIKQRREDLELEYPFVDDERKREIERLLKSPDYQTRDLFTQKNILKQMRNENFDFVVDDGFQKYKINTREFKKQWARGDDASLVILKRMQRNAKKAINEYKALIKKTKDKNELKKLNRILNALQNKLSFTIEKNIQALETGDTSVLDETNDNGDKAYSILNRIVGFSIDRIGI